VMATSLIAVTLVLSSAQANSDPHDEWIRGLHDESWECSRQCAHHHCTDHTIRYGNFCGAVHAGCEGALPCDDYDACCKTHNDCVDEKSTGLADDTCHRQLDRCLDAALNAGAMTWIEAQVQRGSASNEALGAMATCNATAVVRSLKESIDLAIVFSTADTQQKPEELDNENYDGNGGGRQLTRQMDEATWRQEVTSGRRPYSALDDEAFHSMRMKAEPNMQPIREVAGLAGVLPGLGSSGAPQIVGGGPMKGRAVPLPGGDHMYFQSKAGGGFRMAFKPTTDPNKPRYSAEEDAARHAAKMAQERAARAAKTARDASREL